MSYGNRGFIAASLFGLILSCVSLGLWLGSPPQPHAYSQAHRASDDIDTARRNATRLLEQGGNPKEYNPPCHEGQEDRRSDLCAQWRAADAGQSAARWARRSFIGGMVLGFLTFAAASFAAYYAREAAHHTEAGAKAAEQSADSYKFSERAWMSHYGLNIAPVVNGGGWGISPRWKNTGTTPALEVDCYTSIEVVEPGTDPDSIEFGGLVARGQRTSTIGPEMEISGNHWKISNDDIIAALEDRKELFMWGRVTYRDIFRRAECHTEMMCQLIPSSPPAVFLNPTSKPIFLTAPRGSRNTIA